MSKVKSLFKKAWTAVTNPGQDERVAVLIAAIGRELKAKQKDFVLSKVVESVDCNAKDVAVATREYYQRLLEIYWSKGVPPLEKRNLMVFLANRLGLEKPESESFNQSAAAVYFGAKLSSILEDGVVTDDEYKELNEIASAVGVSVSHFMQIHLAAEGLGLLRGLFADAIEDGYLEPSVWNNLVQSATKLGLFKEQLQTAIIPLVTGFAEHVLANAKSERHLTSEDEDYLNWMLESFLFDPGYDDYLRTEVATLREAREQELKDIAEKQKILEGRLDAISPPCGLNLKSGELLYFYQKAVAQFVTNKSSGPTLHSHSGRLLLTDNRLIFESQTKPMSFSFRSIVSWRAGLNNLVTQVANKPEVIFTIPEGSERFLNEKFQAIISLHSRTMTRKLEGVVDRHIPQDVRNRVWQRYGGRCAECGARDYLEFDHIIPVAKGGSNSEQNVQLLCRRCNLAKSDKI